MAFYVGCYLIQQETIAPKHDRLAWAFPDAPQQHMSDTSNVEELHVFPEDMDILPAQIQFGASQWTDEDFTPDTAAFDQFYVRDEAFYVRAFTKGTELYGEFYVRQEAFYVRGFTVRTNLYREFYVKTQENFYVRGWTAGAELYSEFYVRQEAFYVRGWTPVDFFYPIAEDDC